MNTVHTIATAGGLFAIMAFIHFAVDWIFQSHAEAMVKHNNPLVRAKHCLIYTMGFVPLLYFLNYSWLEWVFAINILFWSHFVEDTYLPVFLWAKYIRKPPEMSKPRTYTRPDGYTVVSEPNAKEGFKEFVQTAMGKILMIAIDQIIHLAFLFPLVWMALK